MTKDQFLMAIRIKDRLDYFKEMQARLASTFERVKNTKKKNDIDRLSEIILIMTEEQEGMNLVEYLMTMVSRSIDDSIEKLYKDLNDL
jgi:hypothetical protein